MAKNHNSFNATDEIQSFIEELTKKYDSKTEMFLDIFTKLQNGELKSTEETIKDLQEVQKLDNLKKLNVKMVSQISNINADTEIKKNTVAYYNRRGLPLPKPVQLMNDEIRDDYSKNPRHAEGLMCIDCGIIHKCTMNNHADRQKCRENYVDHLISKHKRLKLNIEEEVKLNEFSMELEDAS